MTYAAVSDLQARFGERELVLFSNDAPTATTINMAIVDQVLADVDATIDGYLTDRYVLPLSAVPAALVPIACDLARYLLATRNGNNKPTDSMKDRYDNAVRWLRDVANGKFGLGLTQAGTELPSFGITKSTPPERVFGRKSLRGYMPLFDRWGRRWIP
jgi:phage gp36-like protein